jgi:hypothetical protein
MAGRLFNGALVVAVAVLVFSTTAWAGLAGDVQQGERLAEEIRSGAKNCSDLSAGDFELIGEYAMSRYLGSTSRHEAINRRMAAMMGTSAVQRMHQALGYRYTECPGGPDAGWVGPMGAMMYRGPGGESGNYGSGMMGGYPGYRRGMMGFGGSGDSDIGVLGVVLIAFVAAAAGGAVVFAVQRVGRSRT